MQLILELLLQLTNQPLIALIGVSIAVSLGSLPFYHIAEQWQEKERATQKKLKPKIDEYKAVFKGATLNAYISTLYRQHNYHPIYAVRTSAGLLMQIPFFFAAYHLLSHYQPFVGLSAGIFENLGKPDGLLTIAGLSINTLPFIMTAINLVSAAIYGKKTSKKENMQLYGIALFFLVVLYHSPSALLFYWTMNNLFSLLKNIGYAIFYKKGEILSKNKGVIVRPPALFAHRDSLFFTSLLAIGTLLFIAMPLSLLSSGTVDDFEGKLLFYLSFGIASFSLLFFAGSTLFFYLSSKGKNRASLLAIFLAIFSAINAFLLSGNYGDMSHFMFEENLINSPYSPLMTIVIIVAIFAFLWMIIFKLNSSRMLLSVMMIYLLSLFAFSLQQSSAFQTKRVLVSHNTTEKALPHDFVFSKKHNNVLVIMLDRFMGGYIPKSLELLPRLKDDFDGFIWYSHMLSPDGYTISGEPPIMGGWDYYVRTVNHTRPDVPLVKKLDESIRVMPYNFKKAGFHVSLYAKLSRWWNRKDKTYLEDISFADLPRKYAVKWMKEHNQVLSDALIPKKLVMFGLFRASPLSWRFHIYDNGRWLLAEQKIKTAKKVKKTKQKKKKKKDPNFVSFEERNHTKKLSSIKYWSVLDYLPRISAASEDAGPQFYYMTNDFPHEPYITNSKFELQPEGKITYPRPVYNEFKKSMSAIKHLYTDVATLKKIAEWLQWMKDNGVYDNTRIIFVSDHGRALHDPAFGKRQHIPRSKRRVRGSLFHNLLLVKDFNAHGPLQEEDKTLMGNGDVPAIALEGIIDGINPFTGTPLTIRKNKFPFFVYDVPWRLEKQEKYRYKINETFKIMKEPIFNIKNWKKVKNGSDSLQ
ncbi:YidC/Oxa1 family membrane protein insertase [bacterium]|nr:YidC/Oxa1 family membrane protein insertase [bacterium]